MVGKRTNLQKRTVRRDWRLTKSLLQNVFFSA